MNNATKFYALFDRVKEPQPAVGAVVTTGAQSEHQRGMKIVLKSVYFTLDARKAPMYRLINF
jgi:hypothetical protein